MEAIAGKVFILCLCLIPIVFAQTVSTNSSTDAALLKRYQLECIEETRVDADLVMQLKAGIGWQTKLKPLKEWSLCVLKKVGLMSSEGVYRVDVASEKVPEGTDRVEMERLVDLCLTPKHLLPEDIAWLYIRCLHINDPQSKFGFLNIV